MNDSKLQRRILVGITGASGATLAEVLIENLLSKVERVYLVATDTAAQVVAHELGGLKERAGDAKFSLAQTLADGVQPAYRETLRVFENNNFFAPFASGTAAATDMVVIPSSMGTLARIASGLSTNLLERSADVMLKEKKRLVICPREAPFSQIHLENMLKLSRAGATIMPLIPGFYQKPKTIEEIINFLVGKVLESLDIDHDLYKPWNSRMR